MSKNVSQEQENDWNDSVVAKSRKGGGRKAFTWSRTGRHRCLGDYASVGRYGAQRAVHKPKGSRRGQDAVGLARLFKKRRSGGVWVSYKVVRGRHRAIRQGQMMQISSGKRGIFALYRSLAPRNPGHSAHPPLHKVRFSDFSGFSGRIMVTWWSNSERLREKRRKGVCPQEISS
jgi:hypothetical protein